MENLWLLWCMIILWFKSIWFELKTMFWERNYYLHFNGIHWSEIIEKIEFLETILCMWGNIVMSFVAHCMSDFWVMSCVPSRRVSQMCTWEGDRHQFLWQISKPGWASFTHSFSHSLKLILLTRHSSAHTSFFVFRAHLWQQKTYTEHCLSVRAHYLFPKPEAVTFESRIYTQCHIHKIRLCQSARRGPNYLFSALAPRSNTCTSQQAAAER